MDKPSRREKKQLEITFPFLCWDGEIVSFPQHWHDCFEILFVCRGGMFVSVNDTLYEAVDGALVMINSNAIHGFLESRPGTVYQGFQFDITFFDESFINLRDIIFQNPVLNKNLIKDAVHERMRRLLHEISREYHDKTVGYQLAVKSKLYELMLMILREAPRRYPEISSLRTRQILTFVLKNADDPDLTLEEAATALKLNKFYFSHFFKKKTGQSFHSYLTKTRVNFAKHYLTESEMPVTDIAFNSGFNSLQTFNRVFKTQTGFTPRDYRSENINPAGGFEQFFQEKNSQKSNN
jgi:AraC-like DNA-binding protein